MYRKRPPRVCIVKRHRGFARVILVYVIERILSYLDIDPLG
jgi:hypothetical protein